LEQEHGICPRDNDPVEDFMEKDSLFVDFLPVPRHVWRELPNFVFLPEDLGHFQLIRDLMFTCQPLLANKQSNVPTLFRANMLLNLLAQKGRASVGTIWEEIINIHPYRHLIQNNQSTELIVLARWQEALDAAKREGFVIQEADEKLVLSMAGVRERRRTILDEGFIG
jgi:hypothetical protein